MFVFPKWVTSGPRGSVIKASAGGLLVTLCDETFAPGLGEALNVRFWCGSQERQEDAVKHCCNQDQARHEAIS